MGAKDGNPKNAIGFLSVVEHPQHGLFGGYLILNAAGRPLEFHCTAPIKPNRAQEILYGPTLRGFLYGEQIGQTLFARGKLEPLLICTDCEPVLALRPLVSMPVAWVVSEPAAAQAQDAAAATGDGRHFRVDSAHGGPRLAVFQLGANRLAVLADGHDQQSIVSLPGQLCETIDLSEPFERIRAAIEEAQQAVR